MANPNPQDVVNFLTKVALDTVERLKTNTSQGFKSIALNKNANRIPFCF